MLCYALRAAVMAISLSQASDFIDYAHQTAWSHYTATILGPFTKIKLNYCENVNVQQSPIDINSAGTEICPIADGDLEWVFRPSVDSFVLQNNGHSLSLTPSHIPDFGVLVNKFPASSGIYGTYPLYCLAGIHIHWGVTDDTGSEHKLDGRSYPLEMHFVHYACDHGTLTSALDAEAHIDRNKLAVVGVMFELGASNPFFDEVVANINALENAGSSVVLDGVDIAEIFSVSTIGPGTPGSFGAYYRYDGSLTTPPCTPIVSWNVLQTPLTLGAEQMKTIRNKLKNNAAPPALAAPCFRDPPKLLVSPTVYSCP